MLKVRSLRILLFWGSFEVIKILITSNFLLLRVNHAFSGTKNVIDACIETKVTRLIYTSSPSVVFDGVHGIFNGDESMPYPDKVLLKNLTFHCNIHFSF